MVQTSLCWLRRDLRLNDHRALYEACAGSEQVRLVFVFDQNILRRLPKTDRRVPYIHQCLSELQMKIRGLGGSLDILHGDPVAEIPRFAKQVGAQAVFLNEDYEGYAKTRDQQVGKALAKEGIALHSFKDQVIFSGAEVVKSDGGPFRVFTPYQRVWLKKLKPHDLSEWNPELSKLKSTGKEQATLLPSLKDLGFAPSPVEIPTTCEGAQAQLQDFLEHVDDYAEERDFPALDGTSHLSVFLRFGLISIREAVRGVYKRRSQGARTWLKELVWREFYQMILDRFPIVETAAFNEKYREIKWPGRDEDFRAWCAGETGFPLIDAAMRQLNQTGWMHNRLRMVVASFLVKDLLIDWRRGEAYFAEKLMDFDLASNNGGWQWCASTGCDPQPYFRIFNPFSQSQKFDAEGEFIRTWVPELIDLGPKAIHGPSLVSTKDLPANFVLGQNYPHPLVDHQQQRMLALQLFKGLPGAVTQGKRTTTQKQRQ